MGTEAQAVQEVGHFLAKAIRGSESAPSEAVRAPLRARSGPVFSCLRHRGLPLHRVWTEEADQLASLEAAATELKKKLPPAADLAQLTVEFSLCSDFTPVDVSSDREWRSLNADRFRGVLGFEFRHDSVVERIAPLTAVTSNANAEHLILSFAERHGVPFEHVRGGIAIRRFRASEGLLTFEPRPAVYPLRRGARLVNPDEIDVRHVKELHALLLRYLTASVDATGRMRYLYLPSRCREQASGNNMIRQWMATWALCRAARAAADEDLSSLVDCNIQYNLEHYYRAENGFGLIEYDGMVKLGAVALAALSIVEHDDRDKYSEVEASLWRTIDHAWQPTGEFRTFFRPSDRNDQQNYYPGEALLAWAVRYAEKGEQAVLERFMTSFRYYRDWHRQPRNQNPAFIPWHTQAYYRVFQQTRDPELASFILEMNDWLLPMQQWPVPAAPECAGRFYDVNRPFGPPHASSTGVYLEGLVDAYCVARDTGDRGRQERYRLAICRGLRSVSQLVYRDRADDYYVADAEQVQGGVRTTCYNNVIRVDNVQHNLLALARALSEFRPEEFSCWSSPPSKPEGTSRDLAPIKLFERKSPLQLSDLLRRRGANQFAPRSVCGIEARLAASPGLPSDWTRRLAACVPAWTEEAPPTARSDALTVAEVIKDLALLLLAEVGCGDEQGGTVELARALSKRESGTETKTDTVFVAWVTSAFPEVSARAIELAARIVSSAVSSQPESLSRGLSEERRAFEVFCHGFLPAPERHEIVRAAGRRGIPWSRVGRAPDIFRLGVGARQCWCDLTTTCSTSRVHAQTTSNKPLANRLYRSMGVPVARQLIATDSAAAVVAAHEIGFPVVTKPWRGSGGRGVSANLNDDGEVERGYVRATKVFGPKVAVEEYLPGDDYRLLFIGGEYVAAAKRVAPCVEGDGQRSIRHLVEAVNAERERRHGLPRTLKVYKLDDESQRVLARQGHHADSVPAPGEVVQLGSVANGGTTLDVTAAVHPDNIEAARRAARIAGIDVCGVDFLLPDPSRSYLETGGGICEVNYQPSLMLHMISDGKTNSYVAERFVQWLVPDGSDGRVPVGVFIGASRGLMALVGRLLGEKTVARVERDAVFVAEHAVGKGRPSWLHACEMGLFDPATRCLLLQPTLAEVRDQGLGLDWCDVVVFAEAEAVPGPLTDVVAALAPEFVRWAGAPCPSQADPSNTILCVADDSSEELEQHLDAAGRAVVIRAEGELVARAGRQGATHLGRLSGTDAERREVIVAVATAWALGAEPAALAELASSVVCCAPERSR